MSENSQVARATVAIKQAQSKVDYLVLAICLAVIAGLISIGLLTGLIVATAVPDDVLYESLGSYGDSIASGVALLFAGVVIILVITRMMRQTYLGNALQVEYSDYAWLRKWSDQVAQDFQMPKVEIMVTQDPYMNAFAFGFAKPYTIVLHSGAVRYLNNKQLKAIVVHEMAHIKYHHTQISTYLSVLQVIPGVGGLFSWIINFWSRRIELTADRLALCYLRDPELVKMALIRVHVGPDVAESFNEVARKWQSHMTDSVFNRFTQTFSNHPFLVRRLAHIDKTYSRYSSTWKPVVSVPVAADQSSSKSEK